MMNHKLTLQLYGVHRPLKWRRRMARLDNRQAARIVACDKQERGWHGRWSHEGRGQLAWEAYKAERGITDEEEERMLEEMPF